MTKRRSTQLFTASLTAISSALTAAIAILFSVIFATEVTVYGFLNDVRSAVLTTVQTMTLSDDFALWYVLLFYGMPTLLSLCAAILLFSKENGSQTKYVVGNAFALSATLVVAASSVMLTMSLNANEIEYAWLFATVFGAFCVLNIVTEIICISAKAPAIANADSLTNVTLTPIENVATDTDETEQKQETVKADEQIAEEPRQETENAEENAADASAMKRIMKLHALYDDYGALSKDEYVALMSRYLQEDKAEEQTAEQDLEEAKAELEEAEVELEEAEKDVAEAETELAEAQEVVEQANEEIEKAESDEEDEAVVTMVNTMF